MTDAAPDEAVGSAMRWRLLAVLALLSAIAPLSIDIYLPALPAMTRELGGSTAAAQLTLTTFLIGLAAGQLVLGPISDRLGRRGPLIASTLVCASASVACVAAPTIETLMPTRLVQGAAGAGGVVIARAIVADLSTGTAAARIFSSLAAVQGLAPVLAPLAGGVLAPIVGWRGVFAVLAALTTVMALSVIFMVGESLPPPRRDKGAYPGLSSSLLAVSTDRAFLAPTAGFACAFGALFSYIAASPFVIQGLLGFSPPLFGTIFAANAVGLAGSSAVSAKLVRRHGPTRLLRAGLVMLLVCSGGLVLVTTFRPINHMSTHIVVLLLLLGTSVAVGQVFGNATSIAISAAGPRTGAGSAVLGSLQFTVGALAAPLVGLGGAGTATPMAWTMTSFAALAIAVAWRKPR